ncbi:MAG TPA: hypothetical protein VFM60_07435 [Salinimicrobium sp.]|nr:hypothetical protein [Salinimicrobium sp.]
MSNLKCTERLNILLEENFLIARMYKRISETTKDEDISRIFGDAAILRHQFIHEITEEIRLLGGTAGMDGSHSRLRNIRRTTAEENVFQLIKKCVKANKENLKGYCKAISQVNNGFVREILLRHKSLIENGISELKYLKINILPENLNRESIQDNLKI